MLISVTLYFILDLQHKHAITERTGTNHLVDRTQSLLCNANLCI